MLLAGCSSTKKQVADQPVAAPDSGIPKKRVDPPTVSARNAKSETSKALAMAARPKIDQLIGLDEASLRLVLGEPAAVEDTAPSKLWVYKRHQCTMNVTLYPDVETKKFHALNYEVNGNDGSARQQQCTTQFSSQLAALPSG
jgi:glucose/arabinose dehydrogenase